MKRLYGTSEIARTLGITRAAVTNIIARRGEELPPPYAVVNDERHGNRWLWDAKGLEAWQAFHEQSRVGRPPAATPNAWQASADKAR
jgi:hypothetical protein